jgi:ubiquinone/menaquinone biosynthesis C-methylase UbiE/uncharacterized protein YbaR (Trm112 family)
MHLTATIPSLTCPLCRQAELLAADRTSGRLICRSCQAAYSVVDGIPLMVPDELTGFDRGDLPAREDALFKRLQADFTDRETDPEWEVRRPHDGPKLYRWLLEEKFRRSIASLPLPTEGTTVLTVCGGSGLDADFLSRSGARVVSADISLEAAKRVRERARRFGLNITPLVADAEALPFPDRSFDLVYVHDGLHHLEDPYVGLAEMTRVALYTVSVNEPARAAATAIAVRFGLADEREEAGNRVERLQIDELSAAITRLGFETVEAHRFAMYYKHVPGRVMSVLSRRATFPLAKAGVVLFNRALGRLGNKLTVQAVRSGNGHNERTLAAGAAEAPGTTER